MLKDLSFKSVWVITMSALVISFVFIPFTQVSAVETLDAKAIILLTNEMRSTRAIETLATSTVLADVAALKARQMAVHSEFAHTLTDGTTAWSLLQDAAYRYQYAGENLAVHFVDDVSLVRAWMNSPMHRANILSENFTEIGVGVAQGSYEGYGGYFVVQLFAAPF